MEKKIIYVFSSFPECAFLTLFWWTHLFSPFTIFSGAGPEQTVQKAGNKKLQELSEGGEAVRYLEEYVVENWGGRGWCLGNRSRRCSGFCTELFHSFSMCFPKFCKAPEIPEAAEDFFYFSFVRVSYEGDERLQRVGGYLAAMWRPAGMGNKELKCFQGLTARILLQGGSALLGRESWFAAQESSSRGG